jgi:aminopeptidase N
LFLVVCLQDWPLVNFSSVDFMRVFVLSIAYLASLEDSKYTELALHEYRTATNMTEQFAALAAIAQNPGETRDNVLADFYSKWQHDFLVILLLNCS